MSQDGLHPRLLRVEVMAEAMAATVDVLWATGTSAIEEQEGPAGAVLVAGYPSAHAAEHAAARLRTSVASAGDAAISVMAVSDDGRDGWRPWARVERAGRFQLVPTWVDGPDPATVAHGEVVLRLDPGPTFGSGSHPTTRLTLAAVDRVLRARCSVLDVGCGSGVLSVAAAAVGASPVVAIDIDPDAPAVTAANAARNGVGGAVAVSGRSLAEIAAAGQCFDVVAANLLAPLFEDLGPDLAQVVAADGHLVASGLLSDRWPATARRLAPLEVTRVDHQDGWVAVTLRAPAPPPGDRDPGG